MSYDSKIWGPAYWRMYHTYSYMYPNNPTQYEKESAQLFIKNIPGTIFCSVCRKHSEDFLTKYYKEDFEYLRAVSSKRNLIHFFSYFHNTVNASLNKPLIKWELNNK